MPHRIAFTITVILLIVFSVLFSHYRDIHNSHTLVTGKVVSVEVRSTRINSNSTQRLFHLIVSMPLPNGARITTILKDGVIKPEHTSGDDITLLYPNNAPDKSRLPRIMDSIVPSFLSGFAALIALILGLFLRREAISERAISKG
ncbi:MAG: DUF3592 domain-containing protein [Alphaproteobacteria bacterium]|nr:DUF3592 domain-containing protein [Alphaproteobacteria bacterium]